MGYDDPVGRRSSSPPPSSRRSAVQMLIDGPQDLQPTLAGGASGGTWMLSPLTVDLLVCVVDHVIALSRPTGPHGESEPERLEVWTLRDGKAAHYRGYPLDAELAVPSQMAGSRRLEAVCRGVLAFNRRDADGWVQRLYARPSIGAAQVAGVVGLACYQQDRRLTADGARDCVLPTGGGEHAADPAL